MVGSLQSSCPAGTLEADGTFTGPGQAACTAGDISTLTFIQVRVRQAAAQLLDDVDGVQVPGALQPYDGVHRQLGEVIFVMSQQFGGQCRPGDVQEVLLETRRVVAMETAGGVDRNDDEVIKQ